MDSNTISNDAFAHFALGFALSTGSYVTSWRKSAREYRAERKEAVLSAMDIILSSQPVKDVTPTDTPTIPLSDAGVPINSVQYAQNVLLVRDYLKDTNLLKADQGPRAWFSERLRNIPKYFTRNRLNTVGHAARFAPLLPVETLDTLLGQLYYQNVMGISWGPSLALNVYQLPLAWLGATTAKYTVGLADSLTRSKDERKTDKVINELVRGTPIVSIVADYVPPQDVNRQLGLEGAKSAALKITRAGKNIAVGAAKSAVDALAAIPERQTARHDAEKDARRKKLQDIIKDR